MDKRVRFDFEIEFTNGSSIQGKEFRLDIAGETISDQEMADYLVKNTSSIILTCSYFMNDHKPCSI